MRRDNHSASDLRFHAASDLDAGRVYGNPVWSYHE